MDLDVEEQDLTKRISGLIALRLVKETHIRGLIPMVGAIIEQISEVSLCHFHELLTVFVKDGAVFS